MTAFFLSLARVPARATTATSAAAAAASDFSLFLSSPRVPRREREKERRTRYAERAAAATPRRRYLLFSRTPSRVLAILVFSLSPASLVSPFSPRTSGFLSPSLSRASLMTNKKRATSLLFDSRERGEAERARQ